MMRHAVGDVESEILLIEGTILDGRCDADARFEKQIGIVAADGQIEGVVGVVATVHFVGRFKRTLHWDEILPKFARSVPTSESTVGPG